MSLKLIFIELLKVIYNLNLELESGGQVKFQRIRIKVSRYHRFRNHK